MLSVEWGLGDADARRARFEVSVPGAGDADEYWLLALVVVLSRYQRAPAVVAAARGDRVVALMVDVAPSDTVGELATRLADADTVDLTDAVAGLSDVDGLPIAFAIGDGHLRCTHRTDVVGAEMARQFTRHLVGVYGRIVGRPVARVGDIDLFDDVEYARVVALGRRDAPARPRRIEAEFAERVREQPGAIALCHGRHRWTYDDLYRRARVIAGGLVARGVRPGGVVGICLPRSADLVATMLAVLMAGATYQPLDPDHPSSRRTELMADTGAVLLVSTDGESPDRLAVDAAHPGHPGLSPAAPAYVIHTSGSTGRPKGVAVPHQNVLALLDAVVDRFALTAGDTWTLFHSCAFDFSVWEIWGCLLSGGRLVIVPYWVSRVPEEFYALLVMEEVTVLSQTPSAFTQLAEAEADQPRRAPVRLVVLGGEPLDTDCVRPWLERRADSDHRVVNMFGITETTVHVTQSIVDSGAMAGTRTVGRPIPGWHLHVLDEAGRLLPPGAVGEIHVGGAGVANGYVAQPGLTADRFRPDPFGPGRLYRSGDRGRLRPDGSVDHLGRLDHQVQVRGHRVEPGEIRAALVADEAVSAAAVVIGERGEGARCVDAYVVAPPGSAAAIRARLATRLPAHLMPATITELAALPLTGNGKVAVDRLPSPAGSRESVDAEGRLGAVLRIWSRVLGVAVGPDDDFFELGGDSVLGVRALRAMRADAGPDVTLRELYRMRTARAILSTR